jgi:hypothetical protein
VTRSRICVPGGIYISGLGSATPRFTRSCTATLVLVVTSPAAAAAKQILLEHIRRLAVAGQLRVSEEKAPDLVHASGCRTVLTLLAMPEDRRDLSLSENAREAVIAAITTGSPARKSPGPATAAVALRAVLSEATTLTRAERQLFEEWLDRLAASRQE